MSVAGTITKLNKAKQNKNDEFYTRYEDIENFINQYQEHLKDKVIYCNCDDPSFSNFYKFFKINFAKLGLKRLINLMNLIDTIMMGLMRVKRLLNQVYLSIIQI